MMEQHAEALITSNQNEHYPHRRLITELANQYQLPSLYPTREFVKVGGFMSYGMDGVANFVRAAHYVDQILKGAKPGEMPIYQPTKFELLINLNAAKALGITVPPTLLAIADEVIE